MLYVREVRYDGCHVVTDGRRRVDGWRIGSAEGLKGTGILVDDEAW